MAGPSTPTVAGRRLATLPSAEQQLIAAIAAAPAGRLSIPALRDALVSQADILAALQRMVDDGRLEPATLRPPVAFVPAPSTPTVGGESILSNPRLADGEVPRLRRGQSPDGEPARPLFDALKAEGARRGLTLQATSSAVFGNKGRIYQLTKTDTVRRATAEKLRAWLAGTGALAAAKLDDVEVGEIVGEIRAFLQSSGMSPTRFGREALNDPKFVGALESRTAVRGKTATRIRAFIAGYVESPQRRPRASPQRRDPTQKPDDPQMDLADRQRLNGMRRVAQVNRTVERLAAEQLDAGGKPRNSIEAAKMNEIARRREADAREIDPVEQAKLALRRSGRIVFDAPVDGGAAGHFFVSGQNDPVTGKRRQLTRPELLALAEQVAPAAQRRASQ